MTDEEIETLRNFKKVFINPNISLEEGNKWNFNEGCLSIPDVREDVSRKEKITLEYFDENFNSKKLNLKVFQLELFSTNMTTSGDIIC